LLLSDSFEDTMNGGGETIPGLFFGSEPSETRLGEGVEARTAIVFRFTPLSCDPRLMFEAMEGWIKCALIDAENVVRKLANPFCDR